MILVKRIAKSIFSLSPTNPGAIIFTTIGIKISAIKTNANNPKNNKLKILLPKVFAFDLPFTNSDV